MSDRVITLLQEKFQPRILVVGDVILDRYLWGNVDRISPEAPIPLLRIDRREDRLGGAGSVVGMLATLGAAVRLVSIVGTDNAGGRIRELLRESAVVEAALLSVADRPTTMKERLLGRAQSRHAQQMIRVDSETDAPLEADQQQQLLELISAELASTDLVLVSDYNKGVCSGDLIQQIVALADARQVPVIADPVRGGDYGRYRGCACITPNRLEASLATGVRIDSVQDGITAACRLLEFGVQTAIVTLDRDGMVYATQTGEVGHFPIRPREVYDITGAGDMVLSIIGWAQAAGLDLATTIELANLAGGLEVERLGVVPITREELLQELLGPRHSWSSKIVTRAQLPGLLSARRRAGQRIVMTNGCFDLLHPGHLATLRAARAEGDCLIVGLNSDQSVRELKGPDRPILDQQGRAEMLAALECVNYVVLFDEVSVEPLVRAIEPDVLVKAAHYGPEEVVGHEFVADSGGRVVRVPVNEGYSTTLLVERIQALSKKQPAN